jgi:hypothetical protein
MDCSIVKSLSSPFAIFVGTGAAHPQSSHKSKTSLDCFWFIKSEISSQVYSITMSEIIHITLFFILSFCIPFLFQYLANIIILGFDSKFPITSLYIDNSSDSQTLSIKVEFETSNCLVSS